MLTRADVPAPTYSGPHSNNGARALHWHASLGGSYYTRTHTLHEHEGHKDHEHPDQNLGPAQYQPTDHMTLLQRIVRFCARILSNAGDVCFPQQTARR
jgi:hypothetical protein